MNIDSNLFYIAAKDYIYVPQDVNSRYGPVVNLPTWQNTYGADVHSKINVYPAFADLSASSPTYSSFARPSAPQEMNLTYGGQSWTRWGAVQAVGVFPTVTLSANPLSFIGVGGITTLTWSSTNADSVVIRDQNNVRITGSGPVVGLTTLLVSSTTTFTATAYKLPNTISVQTTVTVSPTPPPTATLSANPATLPVGGGSTTLTWTSTNADSVVVRDQSNTRITGSGPVNGSTSTTIAATTTFTATAYKLPNTATAQAVVTVSSTPVPTATLTANPASLPSGGGSTTLTWTSTNADSVVVRDQSNTRISGSGPVSGSTSTTIAATTTFTATAYKVPNTATAQATITVASVTPDVTPPTAVADLTVSNAAGDSLHQNITLRWTAPGDDGNTGTANRYDLRWATSLIVGDAGFNAATAVVGTPAPHVAGTLDSMTVTNLDANQIYYFALKTADEAPNWSTLSNVVSSENRALGHTANVSGTYAGYTIAPLTDGIISPRNSAATWASDQSTQPHWVEVDFGSVRPVNGVRIYWAWNTAHSTWMVSQQYTIQRWTGSAYVDVVTVNNATATDSLTVTVFPTVTTQRLRIYQPGNMGPAQYPTIMWQTEIKIEFDTIPPGKINDLGALPAGSEGKMTSLGRVIRIEDMAEFAAVPSRREFTLGA